MQESEDQINGLNNPFMRVREKPAPVQNLDNNYKISGFCCECGIMDASQSKERVFLSDESMTNDDEPIFCMEPIF